MIGKSTLVPGAIVIAPGMMISIAAPATTATFAVASEIPERLARITVEPAATPVTGTVTLNKPALIVTVEGTVAAAVFEEFSVNVRPGAGAGADSVSVRFWVAVPVMLSGVGLRLMDALTVTPFAPVV